MPISEGYILRVGTVSQSFAKDLVAEVTGEGAKADILREPGIIPFTGNTQGIQGQPSNLGF